MEGHRSQADLVVGPIEDGVVLADEDITQDPEVPGGGGDIHALEPTGADPVALEERRIKPELGRRPFGDRRWGLSIQDHGALPATCKEELPGLCLGTWLFLAWGLLYKRLTALWVSRDYQTLSSVSGRCTHPDVSIRAKGFRENSAAGKDSGSTGDTAFSHYSDPHQWQTGSSASPFHSLSH